MGLCIVLSNPFVVLVVGYAGGGGFVCWFIEMCCVHEYFLLLIENSLRIFQ